MNKRPPLIKICGVTTPEDAEFAVQCGADLIGMVFVEGVKREVSRDVAKSISEVVQRGGATSVGVFTSRSIDHICEICKETEVNYAQIYQPFSKVELDKLQRYCKIIYALDVEDESVHSLTSNHLILFDHKTPGSGVPFNWDHFTPPTDRPWILAGGLNPDNVREAIVLLKPSGVDVSSGVERSERGVKDRELLQRFIEEVKST